ncbi:ABC-three component system middle component 1 [Bacillus sp. JJ1562]|uniref:ABC-three component system middle component 1 n=1 Tax=Bacillus sp. JJ1562 TaxID=3122960 RepID=UPI0030021A16
MTSIIQRIFRDHSFDILANTPFLSGERDFFAVNLQENAINFYLVMFLDEITNDFLDEQVPNFFYGIKSLETGYDERMDKNLSLLICLKRKKELSNEERSQEVFQVEEDPYFFKKYVLTYTEEQSHILEELFKRDKTKNSQQIINEVINNKDAFIELKNDPKKRSLYNLCSKLMIKIPFLILERGKEQMEDLKETIQTELRKAGLINYTTSLLQLESTENIENIIRVFGGDEE